MKFEVVVLGAGAAGLFCAIEAGKRGRRVAVIEHAERAGKKILISGGGRCNFTNLRCGPENFLSANPHFCKSALARYTPQDFIALVQKHGIAFHEKTLGQLFCDHSAREITRMLEDECAAAGVRLLTSHSVREVRRTPPGFVVATSRGEFEGASLVVAAGGVSIPKLGATDLGYRLARQFGLTVREPFPALVPLVLNAEDRERYCELSGVSAEVAAWCDGARFREKLLFTHRGLSGPAILQVSSYWREGERVRIDWVPDVPGEVRLRAFLPRRLADRLGEVERVHEWDVTPCGTEGFEKAEVTGGGVNTDELSSKTFEAKKAPGLYFVGEVVDVTGHLGGFNFQWAWSSGFCAGQFC